MKTVAKPARPQNAQEPPQNGKAPSAREKFADARQALRRSLVERDEEVDLCLVALVAREHVLLVGPPGTGKTLLGDGLAGWLAGRKFQYLLTKFTDPGEVFGPIDLPALKAGRTERVLAGHAADAELVVFDEVFKASSAILNTTLTLLNERRVKVGLQEAACPLALCLGLSNEWPDDQDGGRELDALFDRFLFRKTIKPVSARDGRKALLRRAVACDPCKPTFAATVSPEEVRQAHDEAAGLPWADDARKALWEILDELGKEGIIPGDRRIFKSVMAARAAAWLDGAVEVRPWHLEILTHVLWVDPSEQPAKAGKVVARIANPTGAAVADLLAQADDVLARSQPAEAVPKLQEIQRSLSALPPDPRRDKAATHVARQLKTAYDSVIGIRGEEQ